MSFEIFNESANVYVAATRNYKMDPYDREIILFYAKERYYFTDANNNIRFKKVKLNDAVRNMWKQYATSVTIFDVDGDHSDMFEVSHGTRFAQLLQDKINQSL